jgi:transcriptional regulator with XRE-family HTH domain
MADLQQTLGAVLRRERRERGLTLRDLAARAALSVVYLGEIERGAKYPSASVLEKLAEALELDLPDLLELLADALRGERPAVTTQAIGFARTAPQATVRRIVQMLEPGEAATMAELGAFFLARRTGSQMVLAAEEAVPQPE